MANKYLTSFNTLAEYEAASLELPNVSLIKSTGEIKYKNIYAGAVLGDILMYDVANQKLVSTIDAEWNKYDPDHIVCVYNVTSTSEATKLLNDNIEISYQIIDGVKQDAVQKTYTFDTLGEHIVKYKKNQTYIREYLFYQCPNLVSVVIPETITSIGNAAFSGNNNNLKQITIGSGITSIGNQATTNSNAIQSITIKATTPPTISELTWQNTTCPIYVPAESVDAYKTATNWSSYADRIQPIS